MPKNKPKVRPSRLRGASNAPPPPRPPVETTTIEKTGKFNCPKCGTELAMDPSWMYSTNPLTCSNCGKNWYVKDPPTREYGYDLTIRHTIGSHFREMKIHVGETGVWPVTSVHERNMAEALLLDSDRAAAVIAGSLVENRLKEALYGRMIHAKKVMDQITRPSGPLGPFSVKIDVAFMFGIISEEAHKDLMIVKDIRNSFAHHLDISTFNSQSIRAKCQNLKLIETHVAELKTEPGSPWASFNFEAPRLYIPEYKEKLKRPRERYLMTAQLFCYALVQGELMAPSHAYI